MKYELLLPSLAVSVLREKQESITAGHPEAMMLFQDDSLHGKESVRLQGEDWAALLQVQKKIMDIVKETISFDEEVGFIEYMSCMYISQYPF